MNSRQLDILDIVDLIRAAGRERLHSSVARRGARELILTRAS